MFDTMKHFVVIILLLAFYSSVSAQSDSLSRQPKRQYTSRDSLYNNRLNSSGNLMIAGGVGLCVAGGYLVYQGYNVYTTKPGLPQNPTPEQISIRDSEIARNHKQGTIYYAVSGVALAGGIILTAFGARNKVEFKQRKRMMELQSGILDNGQLGLALNF